MNRHHVARYTREEQFNDILWVLIGSIPFLGIIVAILNLAFGVTADNGIPKTKMRSLYIGAISLVIQCYHVLWLTLLIGI